MFNRRLVLLAAATTSLAAMPVLALPVLAQSPSQPIVGIQSVTTYSAEARIAAVDPNARTVTFSFANGATATRKVSPSLANFNAARVGDMVSVGFEDRLTFVLAGPNAKVPANQNVGAMAAASIGKSGAAVMDDDAIQTWWVTAVDPSAGTIALVNPAGGQIRTYSVSTPADREQLPRVKPGDNVTVVNHELLVVSISPKA
ncbi:MAG: hypothetical protein JOY64_27710 [Alphaproteobacteria bacterium]|nr:hypothetical protein [Alphaproteobacteria bacterium]